jgi:hypothetical protein
MHYDTVKILQNESVNDGGLLIVMLQALEPSGCRASHRVPCPRGAARHAPSQQDNRTLPLISVGLCHHPVHWRQGQRTGSVWKQEGEFCGRFMEQGHSWDTNCRSASQ